MGNVHKLNLSQMSQDEIKEVFREFAETKDRNLRNQLIEHHLYIAEILAKRYVNRGIEYDDLFQVASIGLINAIDRYDVEKGFEFSSFATPTIVGVIKRHFRDKGWVIRVPRRIQELSKKVNMAKVELAQVNQKVPTIDDIAKYLEISSEEVIEAMDASQVYSPQSLDKTFDNSGEDKELNLGDLLGVEDKNYDSIDTMDFIKNTMEKLSDIERQILIYRYFDRMTQVKIADELGVSQMTVSRMQKKILDKFKEELQIMEDELN